MAISLSRALTHARGLILVVPWLVCIAICDLLFTILLVLKPVAPDVAYNISSTAVRFAWKWIQSNFETINGAKITISGDNIPRGESGLVVANHVCWSDFYMVQAVAMRADMLNRLRYFVKIQLLWVPFLGWGLWGVGMPLVSRNWGKDKAEMDRVFSGIVKRRWPMCQSQSPQRRNIDGLLAL